MGKYSRLINSKATMTWKDQVVILLSSHAKNLEAFGRLFNPKIHEIHAEYTFWYGNLYTKEGIINSRCVDVGNDIKCIQDIVLNELMKVDDKFITDCMISKRLGNDAIEIYLEIVER
jgi:Holliday junction resolvase RusA-like endonuclease